LQEYKKGQGKEEARLHLRRILGRSTRNISREVKERNLSQEGKKECHSGIATPGRKWAQLFNVREMQKKRRGKKTKRGGQGKNRGGEAKRKENRTLASIISVAGKKKKRGAVKLDRVEKLGLKFGSPIEFNNEPVIRGG